MLKTVTKVKIWSGTHEIQEMINQQISNKCYENIKIKKSISSSRFSYSFHKNNCIHFRNF